MENDPNRYNEIVILSEEIELQGRTYPKGAVLFVTNIGQINACKLVDEGLACFDVIE